MMDMKEQMWLTNVNCGHHITLYISWALVFCIDTHVCTNSNVIGTNKEKEMYLPKKEYISGYRWERINMLAKWRLHMHITWDKSLLAVFFIPLVMCSVTLWYFCDFYVYPIHYTNVCDMKCVCNFRMSRDVHPCLMCYQCSSDGSYGASYIFPWCSQNVPVILYTWFCDVMICFMCYIFMCLHMGYVMEHIIGYTGTFIKIQPYFWQQ